MMGKVDDDMLTMGGHLEVLRGSLFRVVAAVIAIAAAVFCMKEAAFDVLLAPGESDFVTYRAIGRLAWKLGLQWSIEPFGVQLIATDLSSQFMTHVTTALYLGFLGASPYIVYEVFRFVSPALYEHERHYSVAVVTTVYLLFIGGVLLCYYVLFPVSFRFLGTYSVDSRVCSMITLDSYISTFVSLALVMGVVFQLPVLAFILTKMEVIDAGVLSRYRKHAVLLIMVAAAVITPPDIMTLIFVAVPLYLLYEVSIRVARKVRHNSASDEKVA